MEKDIEKLYETTFNKMNTILRNAKGMPGPFLKKRVETLKTELAKNIRSLKPGVLEAHLEKFKS